MPKLPREDNPCVYDPVATYAERLNLPAAKSVMVYSDILMLGEGPSWKDSVRSENVQPDSTSGAWPHQLAATIKHCCMAYMPGRSLRVCPSRLEALVLSTPLGDEVNARCRKGMLAIKTCKLNPCVMMVPFQDWHHVLSMQEPHQSDRRGLVMCLTRRPLYKCSGLVMTSSYTIVPTHRIRAI
jgi:hypothetical protein